MRRNQEHREVHSCKFLISLAPANIISEMDCIPSRKVDYQATQLFSLRHQRHVWYTGIGMGMEAGNPFHFSFINVLSLLVLEMRIGIKELFSWKQKRTLVKSFYSSLSLNIVISPPPFPFLNRNLPINFA